MLWGVGTGRCGTKSLATQLGGLHEPKPWLTDEPVRYKCDGEDLRDELLQKLRERLDLNVPIIVDLKHSYVINLICEVDSEASFIWMLRDPAMCISSFLCGGSFTKTDWHGTRKWHPPGGWPESATREYKTIEYWKNVNLMIYDDLQASGHPWELRRTETLTAHENIHTKSEPLNLDYSECYELYDKLIQDLRCLKGLSDAKPL